LRVVKKGDAKTVGALLQSNASPSAVEPSSGQSALTAAFAANNVNVAKILMAYGADPDKEDKMGKTARGFASRSSELSNLVKKWDDQGAEAFEVFLKPLVRAMW
jgi:ankyrin repeat protein